MTPLPSATERAGVVRLPAAAPAPSITHPRRYAVRMALFLVGIAAVAFVLHEQALRFFLRNPPLNGLILAVLAVGVALSFRAVLSLESEVRWIRRFRRDTPPPAAPPLLAPLAAALRDPRAHLTLSGAGMRSVLDGVESRLDERRETLRYLIALLVFLGLLGTFWGLLLTAQSVGDTIRGLNVTGSEPAEMFAALRAGLEAPLAGMGTAFSTSLFGLSGSLVLGFLDLQASQAQNRFANDLETWLSGFTPAAAAAGRADDPPLPSYLYAVLAKTTEAFEAVQARLDRVAENDARLRDGLQALAERLAGLTDEIRGEARRAGQAAEAELELTLLVRRLAAAIEARSDGFDDAMRSHLRNVDLTLARLADDGPRERERLVADLRGELRVLARTLAAAGRER